MKLKVVIVVYNRYENLKHWLKCWAKIPDKQGAEIVVLWNKEQTDEVLVQYPWGDFFSNDWPADVSLVIRENIGYDIGAFQSVTHKQLSIGEWDRLLWITDDTIPMSLDFIKQFNAAMRPNVGVACMQVSTSVRTHIRTTGFMIDKATAEKLAWHVDPIVTKEECYQFEHRHPKLTFYAQIRKMGLQVVQVAKDNKSPLWDTGYNKRLDRKAEHEAVFGPLPDSFGVTTVRQKSRIMQENSNPHRPQLLETHVGTNDIVAALGSDSILLREKKNGLVGVPSTNEAQVTDVDLSKKFPTKKVHPVVEVQAPSSETEVVIQPSPLYVSPYQITTGQPTTPAGAVITFIVPIYKSYPAIISSLLMQTNPNWCLWLVHDGPGEIERVSDDPRIQYVFTDKRQESWGHIYRRDFLQLVETEFVCISNADNYHAPVFVEYMVRGVFVLNKIASFCSQMVHSYTAWNVIDCSLRRGYIDCAGVVMRTKEARAVGWNDITSHSADWQFFRDLINKYGHRSFAKVKGCLLIHN